MGVVLALGFLIVACEDEASPREGAGPHFVTTIPPLGMILEPMVEGRASVEVLMEAGDSPHTYEPTPSDLRAVSEGAVVVYGAESLDAWAAALPAAQSLALVDLLPEDVRRTLDGEERLEEDSLETEAEVDPHFWTDPRAVAALLPVLADTLCAIDDDGCSYYQANADSFTSSLTALDAQLEAMMEPVRDVPVLLAQPFFRYFMGRYGPRLVDVVEPQPVREPTPRHLQTLIARGKEAGVRAILTQHQLSPRAAEAVAEASQISVVVLDPLGGTEGRETYEALLHANARILLEALEGEGT